MIIVINDEVNVLQFLIDGVLIGYFVGFKNGCNVLSIADKFKNDFECLIFSLIMYFKFLNVDKFMVELWV